MIKMVPKTNERKRKFLRPRKQDTARGQNDSLKTTKMESKGGKVKGKRIKINDVKTRKKNVSTKDCDEKSKDGSTFCKDTFVPDFQNFSDSEEMDSILSEICDEESDKSSSDSEAIDIVLQEMCEEEQGLISSVTLCEAKNVNENDRFEEDDDIDDILDEIANDEEEICSRVDAVLEKNPTRGGAVNTECKK